MSDTVTRAIIFVVSLNKISTDVKIFVVKTFFSSRRVLVVVGNLDCYVNTVKYSIECTRVFRGVLSARVVVYIYKEKSGMHSFSRVIHFDC